MVKVSAPSPRVRPRVRVHPGVAAAAVQWLQLLQLQIQGPIIPVQPIPYYYLYIESRWQYSPGNHHVGMPPIITGIVLNNSLLAAH